MGDIAVKHEGDLAFDGHRCHRRQLDAHTISVAALCFQLANQRPGQVGRTHAGGAADTQLPPGTLASGGGEELILAVIALFQGFGPEAGWQFRQQVTAAPVLQQQGRGTLGYEKRTVHQDLMEMGDAGQPMLGPEIDEDKYIVMMPGITNRYETTSGS